MTMKTSCKPATIKSIDKNAIKANNKIAIIIKTLPFITHLISYLFRIVALFQLLKSCKAQST